jgi:hypothetical protein
MTHEHAELTVAVHAPPPPLQSPVTATQAPLTLPAQLAGGQEACALSGPQMPPLKQARLQPFTAVVKAPAGEVRLSMMTGALQATAPATAAPLIRVRRLIARFSAPNAADVRSSRVPTCSGLPLGPSRLSHPVDYHTERAAYAVPSRYANACDDGLVEPTTLSVGERARL